MGEHMCTVTKNKETINAFEIKCWWGDALNSHGYGHPHIKDLPGGSDCKPVRFKSVLEASNNGPVIHAGVDNDKDLDDDLLDKDDVKMGVVCADAENETVSNVFKNSFDFDVPLDQSELEDLFSVPFEDLEDSTVVVESVEDLVNESFEDLFNESFEDLDDSMPMPESANLKRKSDNDLQSHHKRVKRN